MVTAGFEGLQILQAMRNRNSVVLGQRVKPIKLKLAKQFRREMTPAERILWKALRREQVAGLHFRRQQVIDGFIVDFYCHHARLVIEVDGEIHAFKTAGDRFREQVLQSRGLRVMRVTNEMILTNLSRVIARIRACCRKGARARVPLPNREGGQGVRFETGTGGQV